MHSLYALRLNAPSAISRLFAAKVLECVLAVQDEEHQLGYLLDCVYPDQHLLFFQWAERFLLTSVSNMIVKCLDSFADIWMPYQDWGMLARNVAAICSISSEKVANENFRLLLGDVGVSNEKQKLAVCLLGFVTDLLVALLIENEDTPRFQGNWIPCEELLPVQTPTTTVHGLLHPLITELQCWRR